MFGAGGGNELYRTSKGKKKKKEEGMKSGEERLA